MKLKHALIIAALLAPGILCIGGCASLGLAQPQTLDQKIAYAYGGLTTALQGIATATNKGQLTSAQATQANNAAMNVKTILDTARSLENSDATTAQKDLDLATAALSSIQNTLTSAGAK